MEKGLVVYVIKEPLEKLEDRNYRGGQTDREEKKIIKKS